MLVEQLRTLNFKDISIKVAIYFFEASFTL